MPPTLNAPNQAALSLPNQETASVFTGTGDAQEWTILSVLVLCGSLLRIAAAFQHNPFELQVSDPARWWHDATHLFTIEPILAIDASGYQLWLCLIAKVTASDANGIAFHNALLSVLTPWVWHRAVREVTGNDRIA